jgi:CRISPR-associated protein Csm3
MNPQTTKLVGYRVFEGSIAVVTGLHIGGAGAEIQIGGMDNPVIRHPVSGEPYIPGSSLKGKLRTIIEWQHCQDERMKEGNEGPSRRAQSISSQIFGCGDVRNAETVTRLLVEDAFLDGTPPSQELTEEKVETAINRVTGEAKTGTLRPTERVVPGVVFKFRMSLRVFEGDATDLYVKELEQALRIIEQYEGLGGSTSRGYGRVKLDWQVSNKPVNA